MSPQDAAFHFFARGEADKDKEAPSQQQHQQQRKPHLEEAAMALLLLDVHSAPAKVGRSIPYCSPVNLCQWPLASMQVQPCRDEWLPGIQISWCSTRVITV